MKIARRYLALAATVQTILLLTTLVYLYPSTEHLVIVTSHANSSPTPLKFSIMGLRDSLKQKLGNNNKRQDGENNGKPPPDGYRSVLYFCNWAVYDRKHFPADIPVDRVTHILYAFANISTETGQVTLTDPWADTDWKIGSPPPSPGSGGPPGGQNLCGCFGEFYKLKQKNRHLKILLSIGGWSYSSNFAAGVNTEQKRDQFAKSAVGLVKSLALDGLDLDWEYPNSTEAASQYVDVCRRVRGELNLLASELQTTPSQFELSIAAPAGPDQINQLKIKEMDDYLSFWNLMTYDFAGSWSRTTEYHSNLYNGPISGNGTIEAYLAGGVQSNKLVLGVPVYGRSFANTTGIGKPFNGTGPGTWEAGVYDYKKLPLPGSEEYVDKQSGSAWSLDKSQNLIITYDNAETIRQKAQFIQQRALGGIMYWESSADLPVNDSRSIVGNATAELGDLDRRPNYISSS